MYTQVSDVEEEINGIFTYDREAVKPDETAVREINVALAAEFARCTRKNHKRKKIAAPDCFSDTAIALCD